MLVPHSRTLFNHYWLGQCSVYITYCFLFYYKKNCNASFYFNQYAYFHQLTTPIVSWKPILGNTLEYLEYSTVFLAHALLFWDHHNCGVGKDGWKYFCLSGFRSRSRPEPGYLAGARAGAFTLAQLRLRLHLKYLFNNSQKCYGT